MKKILLVTVALTTVTAIAYFSIDSNDSSSEVTLNNTSNPSASLASQFPDVDFTKSLVDFESVLSGGPVRDGIPALTNPQFDDISRANENPNTLGILVEHNGTQKYYPFSILVWHEIVNDSINELDYAVTFCPLCGSAIVFNRNLNDGVKEFGVSGFLFESNLIMYDRSESPSLWSQARAEAIVGDQAGTRLDIINFQLISFEELEASFTGAKVLSRDTGYNRNYDLTPYSGYSENEDLLFPVSVDDQQFPAKEIFYIVSQNDEGRSVAIQQKNVNEMEVIENKALGLRVSKTSVGDIEVRDDQGNQLPGYYEMWFSWVQHHQDDGEVWKIQ